MAAFTEGRTPEVGLGDGCPVAGGIDGLLAGGLRLGYHLNHVGLLMSQRHLVAHNLVLDGIVKRRIEQYFYRLAFDESHLDDTLTESTVSRHLDDDTTFASM